MEAVGHLLFSATPTPNNTFSSEIRYLYLAENEAIISLFIPEYFSVCTLIFS